MEKTVYVVHCVDTEGPLAESLQATFQRAKEIFNLDLEPSVETLQKLQRCEIDLGGIEQEVAKVFNPKLLGYHQDWPSIDQMLDEIMSAEFRNKRSDSAGNGWLFNWHCIDHFGFTDNPRGRDMKIHAVFDHYRQRPDLADDSVQFHHHPVGFFHQAHKPATNYLSYQPNIFKLLAHKIIDRQWFPSVYRPGFHTTRPDSHWFLEQYIPFEYANQSMKDDNPDHLQQDLSGGRFGDWRRAPQDWTPYHPSHDDYQVPGHCRRWIGRCLNIGTRLRLLDAQSVDLAFEQAQKGEPAILSFTNHDFREISDDIDYVYSLLKQASDKFPEVKFEYQNGLEAMRKGLKLTSPSQKLDFTCRLSDSVLEISSNHNTFGPQPFMAIRTKDGRYLHDNFDFQENFKRWTYHFDDMTVPLEQIDTFGVAANDHYGQTCVVLYDAVSALFTHHYY
jgi:hypothetical protein